MSKNFIFKLKVYYEDTDSGGVVYYANYLKFLERARSELIYSFGLSNKKLLKEYDTLIIVKSCNIQYKKPAKLEDELEIDSKIKSFTKTSFTIDQTIKRKEEIISLAEIVLVTVDKSGKPIKIPKILANFIE
jgi:acyl-CoA thioester hydrolase|tara:strand:+ start:3572 stop:3967 length:396 start_codon:yes stop_codon:yes gene_type:complete